MFNKQLMQYQIFIKNPKAKNAFQKTFLPCKIKMKNQLKIMKQQLRAVLQKQPLRNSRVGLISSKAASCMPFWWKWVPSWVFLKYFAYLVIYCVNGCFRGTALTGSIIILSSLFILILHGRKVF